MSRRGRRESDSRPSRRGGGQQDSRRQKKPSRSSDAERDPAISLEISARRRIFTPFRLAILCALIAISVTALMKLQNARREQAAVDLGKAIERAEAALRDGDVETSAEEYRKAGEALDILEQADVEARLIRQKARESAAAVGLADDSFFDMLQKLPKPPQGDSRSRSDEPVTAGAFTSAYGGSWIVLETSVFTEASPEGAVQTTIDCPLEANGHPVVFEKNLPIFDQLPGRKEAHRVLFAAQIQDCRLEGDAEPQWMITFYHDSAFLWTDFDLYRALGFQPADADAERAIRAVLSRQTKLQGLE